MGLNGSCRGGVAKPTPFFSKQKKHHLLTTWATWDPTPTEPQWRMPLVNWSTVERNEENHQILRNFPRRSLFWSPPWAMPNSLEAKSCFGALSSVKTACQQKRQDKWKKKMHTLYWLALSHDSQMLKCCRCFLQNLILTGDWWLNFGKQHRTIIGHRQQGAKKWECCAQLMVLVRAGKEDKLLQDLQVWKPQSTVQFELDRKTTLEAETK